jgi:TRAP-type mannitol/chloroaromatic compound transport system permease large subunit
LAVALALALGAPADPWGRVFGVVAVGGWLLGFLFGVLQRILPFLASMHAAQGQKRPPTPSALTPERPLKVHHVCHPAALVLLVVSTIAGSVPLARLAAAVGSVGALAFVVFVVGVTWRLRRAGPPADPTRSAG